MICNSRLFFSLPVPRSILLVFRPFWFSLHAPESVLLPLVLLQRLCRLFCSFVHALSQLQGAFHYTCFENKSVKISTTAVTAFRWLHCIVSNLGAHKRDRKQCLKGHPHTPPPPPACCCMCRFWNEVCSILLLEAVVEVAAMWIFLYCSHPFYLFLIPPSWYWEKNLLN